MKSRFVLYALFFLCQSQFCHAQQHSLLWHVKYPKAHWTPNQSELNEARRLSQKYKIPPPGACYAFMRANINYDLNCRKLRLACAPQEIWREYLTDVYEFEYRRTKKSVILREMLKCDKDGAPGEGLANSFEILFGEFPVQIANFYYKCNDDDQNSLVFLLTEVDLTKLKGNKDKKVRKLVNDIGDYRKLEGADR